MNMKSELLAKLGLIYIWTIEKSSYLNDCCSTVSAVALVVSLDRLIFLVLAWVTCWWQLQLLTSSKSISYFPQSRFAEALLRELAGINFPSEKIYGLGTGLVSNSYSFIHSLVCNVIFKMHFFLHFLRPKVEVLKKLQAMPQHIGMTLQ